MFFRFMKGRRWFLPWLVVKIWSYMYDLNLTWKAARHGPRETTNWVGVAFHHQQTKGKSQNRKFTKIILAVVFPKRAYVDCHRNLAPLHHDAPWPYGFFQRQFSKRRFWVQTITVNHSVSLWGWFNNAPFVNRCRLTSEPATAKLSSSWCGGDRVIQNPPQGFFWTTRPCQIVNPNWIKLRDGHQK